jgi:hypothetical protein
VFQLSVALGSIALVSGLAVARIYYGWKAFEASEAPSAAPKPRRPSAPQRRRTVGFQ